MGEIMKNRKDLEKKFIENGFTDFKWLDPENIVIANWVRLKCMFGCPNYGKSACHPNTLPISECEKFFQEYKEAVVFHFAKKLDKPEDRIPWSIEINSNLVKLEREVFLSGYEKAFILLMDFCRLCQDCTDTRETCKFPDLGRPPVEALAVDVGSTVRPLGYPLEVLKDYSEMMNRYAFLMIE